MADKRINIAYDDADNVGGVIRSRIEESEMELVLKSTMGGYTKNSVREYIDKLKKQQQTISDNFNKEMKRLLDEKDAAVQENQRLTERLNKTDSEYKALSEAIVAHQLDTDEYSLQDVFALKSKVDAFEAELAAKNEDISMKELKISQLEQDIGKASEDTERAKQNARMYQEMLAAEKNECNAQRKTASEMTAKVEEHRAQIAYLNQIVSEGNVAELNSTIDGLMNTVKQLEDISAQKDKLIGIKEQENESLTKQLGESSETARRLNETLESVMLQNEKMTAVNAALTEKLEDVLKESIELVNSKANITVEKLVLERKLDAARLKLSNAEMGITVSPPEAKPDGKKKK